MHPFCQWHTRGYNHSRFKYLEAPISLQVIHMTDSRPKRLRFSKRWDERGVASTVGTIMAIMVILALLSLITNHYVPVWMEDSESNHIELATSQLSGFKTTMDNQMMFAEILALSQIEFESIPVYTAIKLGSDGVPVFAAPTQGELGINPNKGEITVEFLDLPGNGTEYVSRMAKGNIELRVPNRYYVPQTLIYENGGILRRQSDGEVVIAEPHVTVANRSSDGNLSYDISINLMWLFGTGSASGSNVEGINSKLVGMDLLDYNEINSSVYLNHTSNYGDAWFSFYNSTLRDSYNPSGVVFIEIGSTVSVETGFYRLVKTKISDTEYTISLELKNPGNCLSEMKLKIGYVEVGIGRKRGGADL